MNFDEIADEINRGAGCELKYISLSPETYVTEQIAQGVLADWAYMLSSAYEDISKGKLDKISRDVATVLGKPSRDFSTFVSGVDKAGTWRGGEG